MANVWSEYTMTGQVFSRTQIDTFEISISEPVTGWVFWEHFPWLYSEMQGAWLYLKANGRQIYAYNYWTLEWKAMPE
jgi:hypothetical protein